MKIDTKKIGSVLLLTALLAGGCGKDETTKKKSAPGGSDGLPQREEENPREVVAADGSNIDGHYLATFTTLNPQVNGTLPGSATFFRKEDRLYAYLRLFAGAPRAWHQQKVYTGSRCPEASDDQNGDGYIDILEAEAVVGKVLIPLDADLSTQYGGRNFYPVGDLSGSYYYERVVSFRRFFNDLKGVDRDPEDNIVKLGPEDPLIIEGRVVMVQGTAETVEYPETVASTARHRPFQTLPIACGVFRKESSTQPGTVDNGEIPGPVADVEEGQDRPAPDEDYVPGDERTGDGTGGGSNEADTDETETRDENGNRSGGRVNPERERRGEVGGGPEEPRNETGETGSEETDTGDSETNEEEEDPLP